MTDMPQHSKKLIHLRREYSHSTLDENGVDPDPIAQFADWLEQALEAGVAEPNAMLVATATADGAPSARVVLLRGYDERGFVFFTDYRSQKGTELSANPRTALVFYWPALDRQVRIVGSATKTSREESEAYFRTRPRGSRLGAWISHQSQVIPSRGMLDEKVPELEERYRKEEIPLPPYWGGFRVSPETLEFWQGRESRLHDRIRYRRAGDQWRIERLSP
jgi:pyridoxamine 5'-phosphate oxidase